MTPGSHRTFMKWLAARLVEAGKEEDENPGENAFGEGCDYGAFTAFKEVWEYFKGPGDESYEYSEDKK